MAMAWFNSCAFASVRCVCVCVCVVPRHSISIHLCSHHFPQVTSDEIKARADRGAVVGRKVRKWFDEEADLEPTEEDADAGYLKTKHAYSLLHTLKSDQSEGSHNDL